MTVSELIKHLKKFSGDTRVLISSANQDVDDLYESDVIFAIELNAVVIYNFTGI